MLLQVKFDPNILRWILDLTGCVKPKKVVDLGKLSNCTAQVNGDRVQWGSRHCHKHRHLLVFDGGTSEIAKQHRNDQVWYPQGTDFIRKIYNCKVPHFIGIWRVVVGGS